MNGSLASARAFTTIDGSSKESMSLQLPEGLRPLLGLRYTILFLGLSMGFHSDLGEDKTWTTVWA